MPTSVPGHVNAQAGFTLLEMMIVLLIIGVATTLAGVSALGENAARALRQDALRLAHVFTAAQVEARASGRAIAWAYDEEGYRFVRAPRRLILPARMAARATHVRDPAIGDATALRPREWISAPAVSVRIEPDVGIVFGVDWIPGPLRMELAAGGHVVELLRLGDGRYVVSP